MILSKEYDSGHEIVDVYSTISDAIRCILFFCRSNIRYNDCMSNFLYSNDCVIFAHRGGAFEAIENSLNAFKRSSFLGCRFMELDIQASSDGIAYVYHDNSLQRLIGINQEFSETPSKEIDTYLLDFKYPIPKLLDVLNTFPATSFQIDFKTDASIEPGLSAIKKSRGDITQFCATSFSSKRLSIISTLMPELPVTCSPNQVLALWMAHLMNIKLTVSGEYLHLPMTKYGIRLATKRFIQYIHSIGKKVVIWTVDDEETMDLLIDRGVDGIITNKPFIGFQVMNRRSKKS